MPLLEHVVAPFAPYWRARLVTAKDGAPVERLPEAFPCGACGAAEVRGIGTGATGSVAGGEVWYDVQCTRCGALTEYAHEWG